MLVRARLGSRSIEHSPHKSSQYCCEALWGSASPSAVSKSSVRLPSLYHSLSLSANKRLTMVSAWTAKMSIDDPTRTGYVIRLLFRAPMSVQAMASVLYYDGDQTSGGLTSMVAVVVILSLAVAVGAVIQGSIGFGYALVAVPAMVLLLPWAVPVTPLCLALPMTVLVGAREWRSIDLDGFVLITSGRLVGTVAGAALLVVAPKASLSVVTGVLIVATAVGSFLRPTFGVNNRTRLVGGVASGVVGTVAALGGTPLALVYQDRSGAELRSTLAISFVVGIAMSMVALAVAEKVEGRQVVLAIELLPGLMIGLLTSQWVVKRLDESWLRPAIVAFAVIAGLVIIFLGS